MFCNETIKQIYERAYFGEKERAWHNSILRLSGSFEYHTTEGNWLVFQTDHCIISLGYDGVKKYSKMDDFCTQDELNPLSGIDGWTTLEETLFTNERIHSVDKLKNYWIINFDNFCLRLYSYDESNSVDMDQFIDITVDDIPLAVGSHLLNRRCTCGGEGQIFLDRVSDYYVSCPNCCATTWTKMFLIDAVNDWNEAEIMSQ